MCKYIHVYTYIHIYVNIYMYVYIYIYIREYIYDCTQLKVSSTNMYFLLHLHSCVISIHTSDDICAFINMSIYSVARYVCIY